MKKRFDQHIIISLAHQLRYGEATNGLDWNVDLGIGTLTFGDRIVLDVQVLGSESNESGTWLWSWANESIAQHAGAVAVAERLRGLGAEHGIDELTAGEFEVDQELNGLALTIASQAIVKAPMFYRCDTGGGAGSAWFLVGLKGLPESFGSITPQHVNDAFAQAMMGIGFSHRTALTAAAQVVDGIEAPDGRLTIGATTYEFDELGRVAQMSGTMGPSAADSGAPQRPRHRRRRR